MQGIKQGFTRSHEVLRIPAKRPRELLEEAPTHQDGILMLLKACDALEGRGRVSSGARQAPLCRMLLVSVHRCPPSPITRSTTELQSPS